MKKITLTAIVALFLGLGARAQQDPTYSMYMFNGLFLNPAYAGSQDVISLMGIYRHQWAGLKGAPRTANISVHSPLRRDQYALGLTVSYDQLGLTQVFQATPAFSYRLPLANRKLRLCFGIQAGFSYFRQANTDAALISGNDVTFSLDQNLFLPNIGAGVYLYSKKFYVGFSVPHLIPYSLKEKFTVVGTGNNQVAKMFNHYVLTAGYVFGKDNAVVKFKPSIMMKYQQGLPYNIPDIDFNAALLFIDRIWIGASAHTGGNTVVKGNEYKDKKFNLESIIGMMNVKLTPQLHVGYAYGWPISKISSYQQGTHEVMLGYEFSYDKKRFVTPRFVKYF